MNFIIFYSFSVAKATPESPIFVLPSICLSVRKQDQKKFKSITGIEERRYAKDNLNASDLGFFAAKKAIEDASIDPELLDYIIFAHNFGDVKANAIQTDILFSQMHVSQ